MFLRGEQFHSITFFVPVKDFVNVACFSARMCKHYSCFYRIRFVTRFCPCQEPVELFGEFLPVAHHISCEANGLQRAVDISLQGKTITFSPSTRCTLLTPCDDHQTVIYIINNAHHCTITIHMTPE